jgi:ubiquinone biosynthesis monooxygenase Coq7
MTLLTTLPDPEFANRVLKVNHAGEHGAVNVYAGQMLVARLTAPEQVSELRAFKAREESHRAAFWSELSRRNQPRCRHFALCGWGGYALGVLTGLFGRRAIAATALAVERVVLARLTEQLAALRQRDTLAAAALASVVDDERPHTDRAALQTQAGGFWPAVLTPLVSLSTHLVIWSGMRL